MFKKSCLKFCMMGAILASSLIGISAYSYASTFGGKTDNDIDWMWWTGWNVQGDYTEAVATNRSGHAAYMKKADAKSGPGGYTTSGWVSSGTQEARAKDFGPHSTNEYSAYGYWGYDQ